MRLEIRYHESPLTKIMRKIGLTAIRATVRIIATPVEKQALSVTGHWRSEFLDGVSVARMIRGETWTCATGGEVRELAERAGTRLEKLRLDAGMAARIGTVETHV